jgi:oligogalacturonide lyase
VGESLIIVLKNFLIRLLLLTAVFGAYNFTLSQPLAGKTYPPEWKRFTSPESGLEVIQLTSDGNLNCGLYFYNDGFNLKDSILVFASKRTGSMNLFTVDLRGGMIRQLTDGSKIRARGATYSAERNEVFFGDDRVVKALDVRTLKERVLYNIPKGYNIAASLSVNATGDVIAFAVVKKPKGDTSLPEGKVYSSIIVMVNTVSGYSHEVTKEDSYISHVLVNPVDTTKILYCHEGAWDTVAQRMWFVNSDGSDKCALRPEEDPVLRVGHEYWFKDGKHVGYQIGKPDKRKYIGILDIATKEYKEYPYADDKHTECNSTGTMFVGDGMPKHADISIYTLEGGKTKQKILYRHNSTYEDEEQHPHPRFSPDDKSVLFTTDRDGQSNIYIIPLR